MLHSCWNVCKSNCYKSMKLGSAVPCTKTIKKIKRKNKSTAVHRRQGTIKPPWGLPIEWKIKAPKYSHIIYQSIANFLFFHMLKNEVFQIWPSFACKFDVLSEKYEKHMLKMNRKPPFWKKIALTDVCASATALTQCSTSESCFFEFAVSGAVLFTSILNKFLTWFDCVCNGHPYGWSTIPPKLASIC